MATTSSSSSTAALESQYESDFAFDEDIQHKRNRLEKLRSDNRRRNARVAELRRQRKERTRRRLQLQIRQQELLNHHSQMELDAEVARAQLQDDDDLTDAEAEIAREMEVHGLADPDDSADEDRMLSPASQSPIPESRQDIAEDLWDESGEGVGEEGPVSPPRRQPFKTRKRASQKGVIIKVSPGTKHLDKVSLRRVLGKFLEYPVVQVFINILEPSLQMFMIQDLKATMERHCDTWKDFDELLSRMMPIATEWNVQEHLNPMQPPLTRSSSRARVTRSWNDFHHDGSPQSTSVFPNSHATSFNYTRILTDTGGKRVDPSPIFKAFLRTKHATADPCIMHRQLIVLRCSPTDECSGCGARLSDFQNPKVSVDYHKNIDDTHMRRQMKKGRVGVKAIWDD